LQVLDVLPHEMPPLDWKHCWEEQVRWTPSQVTELVPTVQVVVPLQESCWLGAEQLKVQQYGAEHSKSRMEQAFEQVKVAVHPVAEAGRAKASRQAMKEKATTAERTEAFIRSPFRTKAGEPSAESLIL
jgi:hypothetical protein